MAAVQRLGHGLGRVFFLLLLFALFALFSPSTARAEDRTAAPTPTTSSPVGGNGNSRDNTPGEPEKHWYDRILIRGYTQVRYNRIGATNPHLKNDQGDKSIGDNGGVYLRRARLVLQGDLTWFAAIYFQPDFASAFQDSLNIAQMRDWYTDIFLEKEKRFRFRVGQQKVPYGFELMQSSSNRLPFDRSDGMNSAFVNERDLGAFFMFETPEVRRRFKRLVDSGLKGSGDFGLTAVGLTNGQPLNTREKNDNKHFFARVTYPFDVGSQTVEIAAGGYTGRFVPSKTEEVSSPKEVADYRVHATFVLYPQPFGLQAEYNVGYGPELVGNRIERRPLDGGYLMAMWRQQTGIGYFTPYARIHRYDGGKKFEQNAPRHEVRELNVGVEWQIRKWIELTTELMASERTVNGKTEDGRLVRLQLQVNY
jgi:hypothetical protein